MSSLADHFLSMASSQFYKQTGMESQTLKIQLPTAGHGRYAAMQLCSFDISCQRYSAYSVIGFGLMFLNTGMIFTRYKENLKKYKLSI